MELACLQCASSLERAINALRLIEQTLEWPANRFQIDLGTNGVVRGRKLFHGGELVKLGRMPTIIRRDECKLDSTLESILDSRKGLKDIGGLVPGT